MLIAGTAAGRVVGKRLKAFTDSDLPVLQQCLAGSDRLIVTPNVWTEVCNICDFGIVGQLKQDVRVALSNLIGDTIEVYKASNEIVDDPDFRRLGLAGCVWLSVLDAETTLLTDDAALCDAALSRGLKAVNFTHLRDFD